MTASFDQEDIAFPGVAGAQIMGTLYRPFAIEPVPLLIDVHGGAWVNGDRFNNALIHQRLAQAGIGVFAIDFRMPPDACYPVAVQDVNAGIHWLFDNTVRCGTTATLVGGIGTSSGAHLLMLNALKPADGRWAFGAQRPPPRLNYVIAGWPILDPLARYRMAVTRKLAKLVEAHEKFWDDANEMAQGNPYLIVERRQHQHLPDLLVLQGTADENVEPWRAELFAKTYRAAGGNIQVRIYEGEPHGFMLSKPTAPASAAALADMVEFVRLKTSVIDLGTAFMRSTP